MIYEKEYHIETQYIVLQNLLVLPYIVKSFWKITEISPLQKQSSWYLTSFCIMAIQFLWHPDAEKTCQYADLSHPQRQFDHVMCFGTFDIFHPGHMFYLSEAQKFAHEMTVVIARDKKVLTVKWREPEDNEEKRRENVQKVFPFARVILGDESDIFTPIRTLHPDILVFGYDQLIPEEELHELFPAIAMERIGGFETEKWKSSLLRSEQKKAK